MAHFALPQNITRKRGRMLPPIALWLGLALSGGLFVAYALWPSWPGAPAPLNAPALPITIEGVLFEVPPGAIRAAVQRHPGRQERIDLAFQWPTLAPPPDGTSETPSPASAQPAEATGRLFVTIAPLGPVLPPNERLRSIYPHYVEASASAGPDGLAILPFRADSPYRGEDLVYVADAPERFFARCTRQTGVVAGNCIVDRAIGSAVVTLRFGRDWLNDWRSVAAGFDRLIGQLNGPGAGNQ
jgi:hypothetical protein